MISVTSTRSGQDLKNLERDTRRKLSGRMYGVLTSGMTRWRRLVISSTWVSPIPSPTSMILTTWRKIPTGFIFLHGWVNYKGGDARADWRKSLRDVLFLPRLLEQIDRALNPGFGPVGGPDSGATGQGGGGNE